MKKALVPLADGFEDVEAVTIVDVLRRGGVTVVTATLASEPAPVKSAHGVFMQPDATLDELSEEPFDAIILPGGGEGTQNLKNCNALLERLRRHKEEGGLLCAICAAPTVLELAGVIEDEDVTCYPSCAQEMGRRIADAPVVADGQIITGHGPGSAMLFSLAVLAALENEATAQRVANGMLTEFA